MTWRVSSAKSRRLSKAQNTQLQADQLGRAFRVPSQSQWPQWQNEPYTPPTGPPPEFASSSSPAVPTAGASGSRSNQAVSPQRDVRKVNKECDTGKETAQLLRETIVYARPEDLRHPEGRALIDDLRNRCRLAQKSLCKSIPWVTTEAERSQKSSSGGGTLEERLLAKLLSTNQELLDVLQMYEELEKAASDITIGEQRKRRVLNALSSFAPTPAESHLVDQIFTACDPHHLGSVPSSNLRELFKAQANLSHSVLTEIWEYANPEGLTNMTRAEVAIAVRLAGHAQIGRRLNIELVNEAGPPVTLNGLDRMLRPPSPPLPPVPRPSSQFGYGPSNAQSHSPAFPDPFADSRPQLPPLTAQDCAKFLKIFFKGRPDGNGILSGDQARQMLMRSRLPLDTLGEIWELADTQHRGALDAIGFIVAMYLVRAFMSDQLSSVPTSLPPSIYVQASAFVAQLSSNEGLYSSAGGGSDPRLSRSLSTATWRVPSTAAPMQMPVPSPTVAPPWWDVSPELKETSDAFFDALDEEGMGWLGKSSAREHFKQSVSEEDLEQIWSLVDIDGDGKLNRDEFAVVLYLVRTRKTGWIIPQTLPESLIPPSMRSHLRRAPSSISMPIPSPQQSRPPEQSLIDLDDATTAPPPAMPIPMISNHSLHSPHTLPPLPSTPLSPTSASIWNPLPAPSLPQRPVASRQGSRSSTFPTPQATTNTNEPWDWDVSRTDKERSDKFFDTLDPWKQGFVDGDLAAEFMAKSKLPHEVLGRIWDLADSDLDGKLSRDEFAVAMHLIRAKLVGRELPKTLPLSLVPPSERAHEDPQSVASTSNSQVPVMQPAPVTTTSAVALPPDEPRSDTPPPPYEEPGIPVEN